MISRYMIPKNASISASHSFVSHLTHRNRIFMFSNPFKNANYDDPKGEYYLLEKPDYVFVRDFDVKEAMSFLQPWLQNNTYKSINKTKGSDELFVRVV